MANEGTINVDRSRQLESDDLGSRVGRSPMLEMRHTVDDQLQAATSKLYLPVRAMFHRHGDGMIVFSQHVTEVNSMQRKSKERVLIMTDRHLYVMDPPSMAIFAPASAGGCFSWKEFSRCAAIDDGTHVIFQFVTAVVGIQFSNTIDMDRCGSNIFSLTGVPLEKLSQEEHNQHSRHFARDNKRMMLEAHSGNKSAGSATALNKSSTGAGPEMDQTSASSMGGGGGKKRVLSSQGSNNNFGQKGKGPGGSGGGADGDEDGPGQGTIENMLRFILDNDKDSDGHYESLFPTKACQTDNDMFEIGIQTEPEVVERGSSPIKAVAMLDTQDQDDDTASNYSDFDHTDVWKSLGTPGSAGGGGGGLMSQSFMKKPSKSRNDGGTGSPGGVGGSLQRGVTFRADPNEGSPSPLNRMKSSASMRANSAQEWYGQGEENQPETDVSGMEETLGPGGVGGMMGRHTSMRRPPVADADGDGGSSSKGQSFAAWLGVLSQYQTQLNGAGIDNANKFLKLTDRELDAVLDQVGMHKHGHRVLLQSKMSVLRQAKQGRK